MKTFARNNFGTAQLALTVAALTCGSSLLLCGGEPLLFPTEKPKDAPSKAEQLSREPARPWISAPVQPPPREGVRPQSSRPVRDPKAERRLKNARDEKENWMIVEPGELQAKDEAENFLGVHDRDFLEKEGTRSIFFDREALNSGSSRPMSSRPPNAPSRLPANQQNQSPSAKSNNTESDDKNADLKSKPVRDLSAHRASELSLVNEVLGPEKPADKSLDRANSGIDLKEIFKTDPATAQTREQKAQRDEFQKFLDTPVGAAPPTGLSDSGASRSDAARSPTAPTTSGQPLDLSAMKGPGSDGSRSYQNFSSPNNPADRFGPNGPRDPSRPGVSGGGQNSPFLQPPKTLTPNSRPSFEPPRRSGI